MAKTVSVDRFAAELTHIVELYIEDVDKGVKSAVSAAGRAAIKTLEQVSPRKTGEYAAGWYQTMEGSDLEGWTTTVINRKPYLTRWLEFGHHLVFMGKNTDVFVHGIPHLDAGFEAGKAKLIQRLGG